MRLCPLAHQEFLRRVDPAFSVADLPSPSFDTQTRRLHPRLEDQIAGGDLEEGVAPEVVSVFLAPSIQDLEVQTEKSDRDAVYDGVLTYGDELIIAIESKLREGIDPGQAQQINLRSLEDHCHLRPAVALVRWHYLMEGWLRLDERGLLSPGERQLLLDFFDFANDWFADLLPFTTLARAGIHEGRVHRRLGLLLEAATGLEAIEDAGGWRVMGGWSTFERISISAEPGITLRISLWPAERKPEAQCLYGDPDRARRLAALNEQTTGHARWQVRPNVNVSNWRPKVRQWTTVSSNVSLKTYIDLWADQGLAQVYRHKAQELPELFEWLLAQGLAAQGDREEFTRLFVEPERNLVDLLPSIHADAVWTWEEVRLDGKSQRLVQEIRTVANAALEALSESSTMVVTVGSKGMQTCGYHISSTVSHGSEVAAG